jgi:hypothetical protein
MDWTIKPLVGIGNITFGMSPTEVLSIMGTPSSTTRNGIKERINFDDKLDENVTFLFENGDLCELGVARRNVLVSIYGFYVFSDPRRTLDELKKRVSVVYERNGFLIFDDIGITLTGFHDEAEEDQAITVYTMGRWSRIIPKAKIWHQKES